MSSPHPPPDRAQPEASRPDLPDGYGVPTSDEGMLPWSWAEERLIAAPLYWIGTTRPDGRPHASPIWGAWVDGAFWFEGSPETRRGKNLAANPAIVVHLERGEDVVIVEGVAEVVRRPDPALAARVVDAFAAKYLASHGYKPDPAGWDRGGLYAVRPHVVIAWGQFPDTATRWRFPRDRAPDPTRDAP